MATPARYFVLNLGMQTVSLAEFRPLPDGGLSCQAFRSTELIVDPAADATRPTQIEAAVKELRTALKIPRKADVHVCLPAQASFARFVRLPGDTAEEVVPIIAFEVQQNVPFPIDEISWDYQIMGFQRDGNWDVVLLAAKEEQLSEISDAVTSGGLKPRKIDVAPMALYNAFRYNYPEIGSCSLLLDIGARTTNLIFIEGERVFSRSIPVGGSTISAAVAKEFGQDINVGEKLKIDKGFVGLGGAYAEPEDPTEARAAKVIRNAMTRLHSEIARSISFYRTSQGGSLPVRVYLCGGTVSLPYVSEFFSEKLRVPVEFFNPLGNVTVSDPVVAEELVRKAHTVGDLVGTALRSLGNCPVEINLRPPSIVSEEDLARRKPFLVLSAVCLFLILALLALYFNRAAGLTKTAFASIQPEISRLDGVAKQMDKVQAEQGTLEKQTAPLLVAAAERSVWPEILDELNAKLPQRFIWVTDLQPLVNGQRVAGSTSKAGVASPAAPPQPGAPAAPAAAITALEINGLYLDNPPNEKAARIIDEFVENLKSSTVFAIGDDKTKVITQRTTPTGENWAYGYTLILPLRTPILIP